LAGQLGRIWSRTLSEELGEPDLVQRSAHPRGVPQHRGPELPNLVQLAPNIQPASLQQRRDERLEGLGARIIDASLPVLDRAHANAHSRRELTLRQAAATPVAEQ